MADTDLFMECEEEELEPWQQINDDVVEDSVEEVPASDSKAITVPAALPSATASVSSPVSPAVISAAPPSDAAKKTVVTVFTSSPVATAPAPVAPPPVAHPVVSPAVSPVVQPAGQQLILTQGPGGLGTMAMSQVLQPMQMMQGTGGANQPIFITTQDCPSEMQPPLLCSGGSSAPQLYNWGFPVRNVRPVQNSATPLGIVLNVQQGQTVRPITLVPAPGTQFFKPAVGVPQVLSPMTQMRPSTPVPVRTPTSTFTTVIPATLTIRSSAPHTPGQPGGGTLPTAPSSQHAHNSKLVNVSNLTTVKRGEQNAEVQKLVNLVNTVNPPPAQPVLANSKSTGTGTTSTSSTVRAGSKPMEINGGPAAATPPSKMCPRCGAQFRMVAALRGHMCFCCPELMQGLKASETSRQSGLPAASTASRPPPPQPSPTPPAQAMDTMSGGSDSQGKLIMLVDDFYYGSDEGRRGLVYRDSKEPVPFKCLHCAKKLKNNIRFMNHLKHHVELDQQDGEVDTHTSCQHCYRQFSTPFQLQCHLESVHSHYESTTKCKICEWAFESEPVFLQHMKNTHKPGEMPYVCQVCDFHSSFYSEVDAHFRAQHEDTKSLLCPYCLKVFKSGNAFQQHFIRHQKKSIYHCNKCRLQFLFTKDKIEHKLQHHKTFRKPRQLEGLKPGTKVTIRAYAVQNKAVSLPSTPSPLPAAPLPPVVESPPPKPAPPPQDGALHGLPLVQQKPPSKKRVVSKMFELLAKFQEKRVALGKQTCLECSFDIPDFPNHYPTYVHCSLCRYSTCCSRAYANHMINNHVPRKSPRYLALYKKPSPGWMKLWCSSCSFSTQIGDLMAKHLVQNPSHSYSTCVIPGANKAVLQSRYTRQVTVRVIPRTVDSSSPLHTASEKPLAKEKQLPKPAPQRTALPCPDLGEEKERGAKPMETAPIETVQEEEETPAVEEIQDHKMEEAGKEEEQKEDVPEERKEQQQPEPEEEEELSTEPEREEEDREREGALSVMPLRITEPEGEGEDREREGALSVRQLRVTEPEREGEDREREGALSVRQLMVTEPEREGEDREREGALSVMPLRITEPEREGEDREREGVLSVRQLRIALFALCCGVSQAAEHFGSSPELIESWLQRHQQGQEEPVDQAAVEKLVEWVLIQREQQLPVNEENLFHNASEIHRRAGQGSSFRISYHWAVGFMLQHGLGCQARGAVGRRLPRDMEASAGAFVEFVQRQIHLQDLPLSDIGTLDEISIFVDPEGSGEAAFQLTGTRESLFDIVLAALADGSLLPTVIFFKGQPRQEQLLRLPDSILLEAKPEGFTEDEELEVWTSRVWQKHMDARSGSKGLLVMDGFRTHTSDESLSALSAASTLPAIIPAGCSSRLQPLDVCVAPALRSFLCQQWREYVRAGGARAAPEDLLGLLLGWVSQALEAVAGQPELVQQSFLVASVLPGPEGGELPGSAAETQSQLLQLLEERLGAGQGQGEEGRGDGAGEPEMIPVEEKVIEGLLDQQEEDDDNDDNVSLSVPDPRVLHALFEKDSDAESFHGFDDDELDV